MQRLKRVFQIDIELCPHCAGTLRVIASIEDPKVIARILAHIVARDGAHGPGQPRTTATLARTRCPQLRATPLLCLISPNWP